jgi:hypothetical protein
MSESVIGGGFASRVIFVYEDEVRQRRMFYRKVLKEIGPQLDEWKLALEADLAHINETIAGDFDISEELEEWFEDWYISHAKDGRNKPKLSGYYERRPAHIIKVAMLLHIAYSDDLVLNKTDFEMAIDIVTSIERNLPRVFESVGKNPYSADMGTILEYVVEKKRCTRSEIRREFSGSASPTTLEELVDGLVASELLLFPSYDEVVDGNGKKEKRFYLEPNYKLLGIIENG